MDCAHLAKNATGNSTFQIKTNYISLPSFSKSTQREHIHHLIFSKGFSGSNYYNTLPTAPFIKTLESDKRRCYYFGDLPERALFISNYYDVLNCCSFQSSGSDV